MDGAPTPLAPAHLPAFITPPGETDVLLVLTVVFLLLIILVLGNLYLRLHSLPERMAHRSKKLQVEIVAILGLLALFTHNHLFWVAALLLAFIELPDFSTQFARMAAALERLAGLRFRPVAGEAEMGSEAAAPSPVGSAPAATEPAADAGR